MPCRLLPSGSTWPRVSSREMARPPPQPLSEHSDHSLSGSCMVPVERFPRGPCSQGDGGQGRWVDRGLVLWGRGRPAFQTLQTVTRPARPCVAGSAGRSTASSRAWPSSTAAPKVPGPPASPSSPGTQGHRGSSRGSWGQGAGTLGRPCRCYHTGVPSHLAWECWGPTWKYGGFILSIQWTPCGVWGTVHLIQHDPPRACL